MVLEKTLENLLDCKETKPVNPKGNQTRIFIGRTDTETKVLILWTPYGKNSLIRKDPDAGKDWRQDEKGTTEVGWHHRLDSHEFEQALGVGDEQGSLACYSHGVTKSRTGLSDWTELNWFPFGWTGWISFQSKGLSRVSSHLQHSAFFVIQLSHLYMTTGKTIALTRRTFVGKVMSAF